MDRVAVRLSHRVNSELTLQTLMNEHDCGNVQSLADKLGKDYVLHHVYKDKCSYSELISDYTTFLSDGESSNFEWGYLVSSDFVLCIGEHISFCHLNKDSHIFPWKYLDRGIYLADTWWFDFKEILDDAMSLSVVDFLTKYW